MQSAVHYRRFCAYVLLSLATTTERIPRLLFHGLWLTKAGILSSSCLLITGIVVQIWIRRNTTSLHRFAICGG